MSVNTVQNTTNTSTKPSFLNSLAQQGKKMLIGGGIGLAAGSAVSLVAPVSRGQIAQKLVDQFVSENTNGVLDQTNVIKELVNNKNTTKEQLQAATEILNKIVEPLVSKATEQVENFFKLAKKDRNPDDIVMWAKKAAKESQSAKIIGSAVTVGILTMLFSDLFSIFLPKQKMSALSTQKGESSSKMGTHQG